MPRRLADPYNYDYLASFQGMNQFMTISAYVLGLGQLILVANFVWSLVRGRKAADNPWQANTLEWSTTSPPPHENFHAIPVVYRGAYEYASPDVSEDYLPQHRWLDGAAAQPVPQTAGD
jgi:cytochrome c oxidase subunit 1